MTYSNMTILGEEKIM